MMGALTSNSKIELGELRKSPLDLKDNSDLRLIKYAKMFHAFYYGAKDMEHHASRYKQILSDFYYIDQEGFLRHKKQGYYNRYQKDDLIKTRVNTNGYAVFDLPLVRNKSNGGIQINVAHAIWVLSGNEFPDDKEIDHIDGNRLNNHISNLRLVNRTINSKNRKKRSDNTSGITGVSWSKAHNAWYIKKTVKGVRLATYRKTIEEAKQVLEEFTKLDPDYTERHGK